MIGNKIKEERIKKDMTQGDLGKAIDVSPSTIGMYEQNRRQPDISTLIKLSNFFNVSSDYLLGRSDKSSVENNTYNNKEKNNDLSPESQKELESYKELLRIKEQMDKSKDETSSTLEKDA